MLLKAPIRWLQSSASGRQLESSYSTAPKAVDPLSPENTQSAEVESPLRVFDGTKPQIYLEWRYRLVFRCCWANLALACEPPSTDAAQLTLEIKARFIRETGERQRIREFVHRLPTEDERDLGLAMYGFGDVKFAVFKARLKVFTESLGR